MQFTRFDPRLWNVITSLETSAAAVTPGSNSLTISGNFRYSGDMVALVWYSKEEKNKRGYIENKDYGGMHLLITCTGCTGAAPFDDPVIKPTLTVRSSGTDYYATIGFYSPLSDVVVSESHPVGAEIQLGHTWVDFFSSEVVVTFTAGIWIYEEGAPPRVEYTTYILGPDEFSLDYPKGLLYLNLSAYTYEPELSSVNVEYKYHVGGTFHFDFNNLYQGELPAQKQLIPVNNVESLFLGILPPDYSSTSGVHYDTSRAFEVSIDIGYTPDTDISSTNPNEGTTLPYSICEGYDDESYRTPERLIESAEQYGFKKNINIYIGATHYYDKVWGGSEYSLITGHPFNQAFSNWIQNFLNISAQKGKDIVLSVAFEMYEAPATWWQKGANGEDGQSGWQPITRFLSPTNPETLDWHKMIIAELVSICNDVGITPRIQIGEPWWWWQEFMPGDASTPNPSPYPCFYDAATVSLYQSEMGSNPPIIPNAWCAYTGNVPTFAEWLNTKLKKRVTDLAEYIHSLDGLAYLLYFPPSVEDLTRVPRLMYEVNNIRGTFGSFDVVQVEDYDWVTSNNFYHTNVYFPLVPAKKLEYFAGFALIGTDIEWQRIERAGKIALSQGYNNTYIWAGTQIRRDGKLLNSTILPWKSLNISLIQHG